jgi:hypothetical protein
MYAFVCVTVFLVGFRLLAMMAFPTLAIAAWLIIRKHPIARFVSENIFALKGGGYGCFFRLSGLDEEGLTDQELESNLRMIEGSLRGMSGGAAL